MIIRDVESFFTEVDSRIDFPLRVILTGGAAGILYGMERATFDIDFEAEIIVKEGNKGSWDDLQKALEEVSAVTRITPQYADDIDRWSSIALPSKNSSFYKKIGKIEIRILEPSLWAIGKLTRYLSSDVEDLATVLKYKTSDGKSCVRRWGEALAISPPSSAQAMFRRQVERFLDDYAKIIWGEKISAESLKKLFIESARLKSKGKKYKIIY